MTGKICNFGNFNTKSRENCLIERNSDGNIVFRTSFRCRTCVSVGQCKYRYFFKSLLLCRRFKMHKFTLLSILNSYSLVKAIMFSLPAALTQEFFFLRGLRLQNVLMFFNSRGDHSFYIFFCEITFPEKFKNQTTYLSICISMLKRFILPKTTWISMDLPHFMPWRSLSILHLTWTTVYVWYTDFFC